ncbi:protein of unknown function DUF81 [Pirellula staleyi DSM 6068]|uniref:Probable membrane transporter protein n=1 Tax=Pirellula staleyi (strain ATCC 27377 / DSM 6068 / ICPB 4128) TaxID=530564 RepID=D2QXP2_PIRSD|nr:sulfite exporter TauE/SafE family protein [Pirellula staleyi]ADB16227.1 protein of unknown function DUF81 [Pirellula staleyi DSM 6068]
MPDDIPSFAILAAILLVGSVLQGMIGFASALLGTPLFLLAGVTLPQAVAINLIASTVQNVTAAWKMRREIDFRGARRPALLRLVTLPLGALCLYLVGKSTSQTASIMVGLIVLTVLVVQTAVRVKPRDHWHAGWEFLTFLSSGFLLGLCGMGGPPVVLWVLAHRWEAQRSKAFLFFIFASGMLPQAICLALFFGWPIIEAMGVGLLGIPILLLGTLMGLKLGALIPAHVVRPLSTLVLAAVAISAIAWPLSSMLGQPAKSKVSQPATSNLGEPK